MHVSSYAQPRPFITLDGLEIREWAGRVSAPAQNQSLAEATIPVGGATTEHLHRTSEELRLVCVCSPAYTNEDTVLLE
jgi:hypothetical protein